DRGAGRATLVAEPSGRDIHEPGGTAVMNPITGAAEPTQPRDIVVIGSGFGGLASAIRLQAAGHRVTIVEARERVGGRAYQLQSAGYTFDMGPSLITAPHLLQDLWAAAGRRFDDDIDLVPLDPYYRIYFRDGRYFDYGGSVEETEAEVAKFNPDDVAGLRAFMRYTEKVYKRAFDDLAGQPFHRFATFASVTPELIRLGAQRSVYDVVSRYISDPFLRMVYSFHPLFIGGNPLRASAIYSIVPYLERIGGVHFTMGGMYSLVEAMEQLFIDLGGQVRCGDAVGEIVTRSGRVAGVYTEAGRSYPADAVVANSDVARTLTDLFPPQRRKRRSRWNLNRYRYSMSCFLLYLGLDRQYDQLKHHTILMPDDYERLLTEIFDGDGQPSDLALYLHAPTKTDPNMAPPGGESLYILAPVPHLGKKIDWEHEADGFRDRIINFLEHDFGMDGLESSIVTEHRFTPLDFRDTLRSHLGSAFSIEPTLLQSAYFRPHNRSRDVPGLYFTGAGTHPGAGIPGVLLSAQITSRLVHTDLATGRDPAFSGHATRPSRA
ncbi:MAG: phytoene desaturase family protein, partial [Chloroflexota bacterium]